MSNAVGTVGMTLIEFLEDFKTIAPEFTWKLQFHPVFPIAGKIRGFHKNGKGFCGCPITCYNYAKNGGIAADCSYRQVAEKIGIDKTVTEQVAYAADDCQDTTFFSKDVRNQLINITGLAGLAEESKVERCTTS